MRARVGDLAIANFNGITKVCLVIGTSYGDTRKFVYFDNNGHIHTENLPRNRLMRACPKESCWDGTLKSLTLDSVIAVDENTNPSEEGIQLGGCYHSGVAWGIGYNIGGDKIELHNKIFTTFDSGINGGVAAELKKLRENFDPSRDIPKFAVALKPVRIVEPDDDGEDTDNAGCDQCGCCDRVDGETWCEDCLDTYCPECEQPWEDCTCNEDDGDDDDYCPGCDNYQYCDCDELDEEFVADTFSPMNAFARARWLKACGEL